MSVKPWKAGQDIIDLMNSVRLKNHSPRLESVSVGICFDDSKPFNKNKLNLGKVVKFNDLSMLWHTQRHDFCVVICSDVWYSLLDDRQREALLDLQLTRCEVEYIPVTVEENGKKKVVKDQWGRVEYTEEFKLDKNGDPIWKVLPLDLTVFSRNVRRYGMWLDDLEDFKEAITDSTHAGESTTVPLVVEL